MLDITTAQTTGTSPYFGGILAQWQPEAASINETEPAFRQTDWTAWDLVLYTVSSNQLLADNGIGLDALLTQLFGQAVTWYKEYAYLNGKGAGSSMPLGILNAPATYVQSRYRASTFQLYDATAMMSHLQIRSWDDACWIMHQSVIPQLIQMVDYSATTTGSTLQHQSAGGHFAWMTPYGDGKVGAAAMKLPNAFLNGLPIYFTEKLPSLGTKGDVMLVDWSRYVIGMRLDMQIDISPHFLFRNNQLAWRVIARLDGKPWLNNTITDANGWSVSPFVVLS
jgi:HK97 family phage major capsid protein